MDIDDLMQPLPIPDEQSLAHSERCAVFLREAMAEGSLSFAQFMNACLYTPGLGYYAAGSRKFGAGGDFVTAPEISPVFSRVLARQVAAVLEQLEKPDVLEFGAGSGAMAAEVFGRLKAMGEAPEHYLILEVSPDLRERQQRRIAERLPSDVDRFRWIDEIPGSFNGVILANEVLDALPVERFEVRGGDVFQQRVTTDGDRFVLTTAPAPSVLTEAVSRIESDLGTTLPEGFTSEICTAAFDWTASLVNGLREGAIFLFDYGVGRDAYYAPDRDGGWLRCHFRHHAHSNPLVYPGIQDITAWVDFSLVAEAAVTAGAEIGGYVTQAHFLMAGGLDAELELMQDAPLDKQLELASAVKTLTLPGEMGEHVKCLGLVKGNVRTPDALTMMDITHTL